MHTPVLPSPNSTPVCGTLCDGLDENDKVNGCYHNLEDLLVRLAQFYLNSDLYRILMFFM